MLEGTCGCTKLVKARRENIDGVSMDKRCSTAAAAWLRVGLWLMKADM